ncbi:MAG: hypothetical protein MUF45_14015 [Spirosomaceae bacterium]|jgi:hypothetical protein|nr:hypothetical protein [Spirosomataceae bacterium]
MKVQIKSVIFAVLFGSFITLPNIVKANDRDSARKEVVLARGAEVDFAGFMNKNAKKIVKSENWHIFTEVVTLYNTSPSKLMAVSAEKKEAFNEAVATINAKLARNNKADAKDWKRKVNVTAGVINYLWNYKVNIEPTQEEESPTVINMLGR